jgi:hypothetical protein
MRAMNTTPPPAEAAQPQTPANAVPAVHVSIGSISAPVTDSRGSIDVGDVTINVPPPTPALHQLPAPPGDFTGREVELCELLGSSGAGQGDDLGAAQHGSRGDR